jgi:dipeptidyl aminopeptidase/acylaminoacyl peptidase
LKEILMLRFQRFSLFLLLAVAASAQVAKRPLNHHDYDSWRTIGGHTLSRDGKFLAYSLFPEEGDGELVVKNLSTGKELRENCGSAPPPTENPEESEGPPIERGIRVVFSHDSAYLVASAFPQKAETEQAKKDHKRPDQMPHESMIVVNLGTFTASRVADVASFQVPELGESFVAYLHGPKAAADAPAEPPAEDEEADQGRGRGANAPRGRSSRSKYGSDLVLRNLGTANERSFEDVLEFSIAKDAKTLLYAVGSKKEETDGLYSVVPGDSATPVALLAGKGHYTKLTWDFGQHKVAFLSDHDDQAAKPAKFKAYLWERSGNATEAVSASMPGFHAGWGILERGPMSFSRDGSRLFVSCAPMAEIAALEREIPPAPTAPSNEKVIADLWSWKDDYVQAMQKVRATRDRARAYSAVYILAEKKFLQIADPEMATISPSDSGRYAIGMDDRAYRRMVDYDGNYNDVYLVDTETGARTLALKQFHAMGGRGSGGAGGVQLSPDGHHALVFRDKQWWLVSSPDGAIVNLTAHLSPAFYNEDHDTPDSPTPYGSGGWTSDGKWAVIYDRYDAWAVSADGAPARKLTDGRQSGLEFRVARLNIGDEEERGIDPAKQVLYRVENLETRESGFYSSANFTAGAPHKLIMGAKNYRVLGKAKDADVIMVTATTFHDQPDVFVGDSSFRNLKKETDANPQQKGLVWGTSELIHYRNSDGVLLQAALYKPENFDPSKKYPMMIYLYERLTANVNNFVRPAPGHSINFAYYVSNGYLVLTPDIVYTTGHPGQSALKCVLPAIQAVVDKGYVDKDAIGIQGHSWGGYQTAYMVTQTNVFHAAEAGAPVANMISAYDGIRWGTGLPRQFQSEKTQSRIGATIWESPLRYVENSPIFSVDRITTPLLILQNDADDAVPWYQGLELFLSLRRLGKEAYLFDYNGEPHHINRRPNQKDYTVRMQQFFDHFLKGGPEPEWMQKGIPYIERDEEKERFNKSAYETSTDRGGSNDR